MLNLAPVSLQSIAPSATFCYPEAVCYPDFLSSTVGESTYFLATTRTVMTCAKCVNEIGSAAVEYSNTAQLRSGSVDQKSFICMDGDICIDGSLMLSLQGPDSRIFMKHCTLSNNEASGLWIVAGAKVTAESCDFQDNRCNGAALWDVHSTIACRSCTFRRNCTNGLRILYGASASLLACTVAFNQDQGVEAGEAATRVRIEDSTLTCTQQHILYGYAESYHSGCFPSALAVCD